MSFEKLTATDRTVSVGSSSSQTVIEATALGKLYQLGDTRGAFRYRSLGEEITKKLRPKQSSGQKAGTFWALRELDFSISEGEVVGIIGRNGAGKSTLLKILSRITLPTVGTAKVRGRVGSLLEVGTGFHPELTGRDNIFLSGAVLGMRRAEITSLLDAIVDFAGIDRFVDTPIKRYSTGMYLRLAFAVAAHLQSDILLVDEVLAVGDTDFQKKCLGRMADIGSTGRTVLFVSHSIPSVLRLCPRVMLLDRGRLLADGPAQEVTRIYLDSGLGTSAERTWNEPDKAPGDSVARLKAVRVLTKDGTVSEKVNISDPVSIQVEFWHLSDDRRFRPIVGLHIANEDGVVLFTTRDFYGNGDWAQTDREPGTVTATCCIPGNFLAEGRLFVEAAICSFNPLFVHIRERDAVTFQVADLTSGDGARGDYTNEWPGVVRPVLNWTTTTQPSL